MEVSTSDFNMDMDVSTSDFNNTPRGNVSLRVHPVPEVTQVAELQNRPVLVATFGILLNTLTLVAVVKHKDLTPFLRCLLVSLVVQNIGLLALMFTAGVISYPSYAERITVTYLSLVCVNSTALTLLVIAVDRVTAVYFPLCYKASEKGRAKIALSVLSPWVLGAFFTYMTIKRRLSNLPFVLAHMTDSGLLLQGTLFLLCGAGVFFAYLAVGVRLRLGKRRVVVHPSFLSATATERVITPAEGQRSRRLTVHIAFLAVWFCLVYITCSGYVLFVYVSDVDVVAEINSDTLVVMSYLLFLNSIINPFLISWRLVSYRSVLDVLRRLLWRLHPPRPASQSGIQPPRSQHPPAQPLSLVPSHLTSRTHPSQPLSLVPSHLTSSTHPSQPLSLVPSHLTSSTHPSQPLSLAPSHPAPNIHPSQPLSLAPSHLTSSTHPSQPLSHPAPSTHPSQPLSLAPSHLASNTHPAQPLSLTPSHPAPSTHPAQPLSLTPSNLAPTTASLWQP